ncbi:unnamed protein product [Caenorhabditis auriculariae]|uniref:Uncharacterized protein n=1 Tax=Caenorhabditis auriculariae TaxID=2777116 RepID=A0A8S1GTC3_9PELO|nr:unnamed protein product [Caenorhabditis auriculariae]
MEVSRKEEKAVGRSVGGAGSIGKRPRLCRRLSLQQLLDSSCRSPRRRHMFLGMSFSVFRVVGTHVCKKGVAVENCSN